LASIPRSILCCLMLAFSFLRVTTSFVRPSFSKHKGIGEPAQLFEAPLGEDALLVGAMRFPMWLR
jgi:hypothetical protein